MTTGLFDNPLTRRYVYRMHDSRAQFCDLCQFSIPYDAISSALSMICNESDPDRLLSDLGSAFEYDCLNDRSNLAKLPLLELEIQHSERKIVLCSTEIFRDYEDWTRVDTNRRFECNLDREPEEIASTVKKAFDVCYTYRGLNLGNRPQRFVFFQCCYDAARALVWIGKWVSVPGQFADGVATMPKPPILVANGNVIGSAVRDASFSLDHDLPLKRWRDNRCVDALWPHRYFPSVGLLWDADECSLTAWEGEMCTSMGILYYDQPFENETGIVQAAESLDISSLARECTKALPV